VDRDIYDNIRTFARESKCTPFMVLFAAFEVLLFERSGRQRFTVGVPAASRSTRPHEVLVGNFVNLLPIVCLAEAGMSFARLLDDAKLELLGAYRHAQYPCPYPTAASSAYATFNMEPYASLPRFGDLDAELSSNPVAHVEFGLMMNVTEAPAFIAVDLDFREQVLGEAEALQWLTHYQDILKRVSSDRGRWSLASQPVADVSA
jgi:non-ribosomal peptide synthetase component F